MPQGAADWRCGSCLAHPPAWDGAFSTLRYALPVDTLIQQLKFQGRLARARLLGDLMAATLTSSRRTPHGGFGRLTAYTARAADRRDRSGGGRRGRRRGAARGG